MTGLSRAAFSLLLLLPAGADAQRSLVNFAHLDHLTEWKTVAGESVAVVHVYANYPSYDWVSAAESGPEGVACVDDAARAAVLCLRAWELRRDSSSLRRALGYLRFVRRMQTPDGEFYNFIFADGTINRTGRTSAKSFGWWAARGIWALATGARILAPVHPALADTLARCVERSLPRVRKLLERYGRFKTVSGYRVPQWLLYDSGADVTSELLLGLLEIERARPRAALARMITGLADGLRAMQDGTASAFPFGLHRSWETMWHMWGNGQTQALASAATTLGLAPALASAEREARAFYVHLLTEGFFKEMDVARPDSRKEFEQIAYGVRPMAVGLVRLYERTTKREYAVMAGLAASWLTGNNVAGKPMYEPETGRGLDGIRDSSTINLNSGAESTIEALTTLLEVEQLSEAKSYLSYRRVESRSTARELWGLYEDGRHRRLLLRLERASGKLETLEGDAVERFLERQRR